MKIVFAVAVMAFGAVGSQETTVENSKLDANGASRAPSISDDGDIIVFESTASNLVSGDKDSTWDVFVHSRKQHRTWCISSGDDVPARRPTVSGNGRWVAYLRMRSETSPDAASWPTWSIILHDLQTGLSRAIEPAGLRSAAEYIPRAPAMSRDGRWIVYASKSAEAGAVNLAYLYDRESGTNEVVSVSTGGEPPDHDVVEPWISSNGRFVLFCTDASNLGGVKRPLPSTAVFEFLDERAHVFLRDRESASTTLVSDLALRELGYADYHNPRISEDGRYVAYDHHDSRWGYGAHVGFVSDLVEERGGRLLPASLDQSHPQGPMEITWMSPDGWRVLVETGMRDLVQPGVSGVQIYERDLANKTWTVLSRTPAGITGNNESRGAVASNDMNTIVFWSFASNLVEGDDNGASDVFVLDKSTGRIERISVAASK